MNARTNGQNGRTTSPSEREPNHSRRVSLSLETRVNECMDEGDQAGPSPILGETCELVTNPDLET